MSKQGSTERRSWRQQKKSGNRWIGRLVSTAIALLLIGFIVYFMWDWGSKRRLRTLLVHAGSYESGFIMPPMFGDTAALEIAGVLDSLDCTETPVVELRNTAPTIRSRLTSALSSALSDDDDTTMVIIRGYLLLDEEGRPAIACTDLGFATEPGSLSDLLPLSEILEPLAIDGPAKSTGGRIVVLDIEPLGIDPRLSQSGDAALATLEQQLGDLSGPHAERLWVLVTRGPLQCAGWDPKTQMPISTQTFLDGIRGEASGDDRTIHLDELASYMAARYERLAVRNAPQIIVMQGGVGQINELAEIRDSKVWLAFTNKESAEESTEEQAPPTEEATDDENSKTDDPDKTATRARSQRNLAGTTSSPTLSPTGLHGNSVSVSRVVFRSLQDESDESTTSEMTAGADPNAKSNQNETNESGPGDNQEPPNSNHAENGDQIGANPSAADGPSDAPNRATTTKVSFWDLRDQLQEYDREKSLHPVAVAPHLWRRLVLKVLHWEIESLDDNAPKSRAAESLKKATRDLELFVGQIQSPDPSEELASGTGDDTIRDIQGIYDLWVDAKGLDRRERVDAQVRSADALQFALAVGWTRWWSLSLYQQQAIANGGEKLDVSSEWSNILVHAEQLLADQDRVEIDRISVEDAKEEIWKLVQNSNETIEKGINDLLDNFARVHRQQDQAWAEIRQAYVWLRTPLPTGSQRRKLKNAIGQSSIGRVSKELLTEVEEIDFAKISPSSPAKIEMQNIERVARQQRVLRAEERSWDEITSGLTETDFATSFPSALRMDPRDVELDRRAKLLLNAVAAIPRKPEPWIRLKDASGNVFETDLDLDSPSGELSVEIFPDSRRTSTFTLSYDLPTQSRDEKLPFSLRWQGAGRVTLVGENENKARLTIPPSNDGATVGTAKLRIATAMYANRDVNRVPIRIRVEPDLGQSEPHVEKLRVTEDIKIGLPQRDKIRVAVKTDGLTKKMLSGDDFPGGVWLRTFASRNTSFDFELFNDSGRRCRAKVWLLRFEHPFYRDGVDDYWPELLAARLDRLRSQIQLDADGRVVEQQLDGDRRLKGPTIIQLEAGGNRTKLDWTSPEAAADGAAPAAASGDAAEAEPASDVSHGMALVVRLIDEDEQPLPGGDQFIWLIPNPLPPDDYVHIDEMQYVDGQIQIRASIKGEIDGDDEPDEIPNVESNVRLSWHPDEHWKGFRAGQSEMELPSAQEIKLYPNPRFTVKVFVEPSQRLSSARLDVDDWPGAIRWYVEHKNAVGREQQKWNTLRFASVEMNYGENPTHTPPDEKVSDTKICFPESGVELRGGGQALRIQLKADFSDDAYRSGSPPEIRLYEGDNLMGTYWSDRSIDTKLVELKDNGRITLLTSVGDLMFDAGPAATIANDRIQYRAELRVDRGESAEEALSVTLDSSPPIVDTLVVRQDPPYIVGQEVEWTATFTDRMTEVTRIVMGPDANGDGRPEGDPVKIIPANGRFRKTFPLSKEGPFTITAQVWDKVGKVSRPFPLQTIYVSPKPKPPKPIADPNPGGSKPAAPTPPPPPPNGKIVGVIETRSTFRGTFTLDPAPDKMVPENGEISVGEPNPRFEFSNLPPQQYTLTFKGTVNGTTVEPMTWPGLKIDTAGGKKFNRLPKK